jgi:hypothetical protein
LAPVALYWRQSIRNLRLRPCMLQTRPGVAEATTGAHACCMRTAPGATTPPPPLHGCGSVGFAHAACIALRRPYPQSQIRAMEKQTTIPQIHGHPFFGERPLQFAFRAEIIALRLRRSLCPSLLGRTFCFCCCARSSAAAAAPFLPLRIDSRFGGELASRA